MAEAVQEVQGHPRCACYPVVSSEGSREKVL